MTDSKAERFVTRLRPLQAFLEAVCRKMVWERASWEDVLQKAMMIAWNRFDSYDENRSFRSWVFSVLCNTILNENRSYRRLSASETPAEPDKIDYLFEITKEEAYQEVLKEPELTLGRFRSDIEAALRELAPTERAAFLMRSIGELKYLEIADALSIPIGTVMSHLHRARLKLRERLAEEQFKVREPGRNNP